MLTVRAVHFDLDGVLADSAESVRRAWRRWAARRGVAWPDLAGQIPGRLAVDTIRAVRPDLDATSVQADADLVNAWQVADQADSRAVPGLPELVAGLGGVPWSVVTGAPRALATARLSRCGYPVPRVLVAAQDVARGKPSPEGYLLAARRLGIPITDSLVVEDSPAGIKAGLAAGAAVLAITDNPVPGPVALAARDGREVAFQAAAGVLHVRAAESRPR
ncbi:MAG TPA: HAD-IA family hydrolase [Streptosporangiaceae bacterium]